MNKIEYSEETRRAMAQAAEIGESLIAFGNALGEWAREFNAALARDMARFTQAYREEAQRLRERRLAGGD